MRFILFIPFIFLFIGCGDDADTTSQTDSDTEQPKKSKSPKEGDCKYSKPIAIFSDSLAQISKQSFELIGQKGIETVEFTDGNILELYQSGCNEVRQEYRFFLKGEFKDKPDSFWFEKAIEKLSFVGNLDDKYAVIGLWVGALDQLSAEMKIGQFSEVEQNTFLMVDKLVEAESAIVIIVLERRI